MGTGHAGTATAIQLRQLGFTGSIGMIGAEDALPYERPPLSKAYLAGTTSSDDIRIRPPAFWAEREIGLVSGERIVQVDPIAQLVTCQSGRRFNYGELVWTAGGRARRLPCEVPGMAGVHAIRSLADVDALRAELATGQHWALVGGGYVGLEAAAALVGLGIRVTVIEQAGRLLARTAAEPLSRFLQAEHARRGVDFRFGRTVRGLEGRDRVETLRLDDDSFLPVSGVIVGIGIVPVAEPLRDAGADGQEYIAVDACGRTSLPSIWAAGDCVEARNSFGPEHPIRIESIANAADGAAAIARALTGVTPPRPAPPWFWSTQYDLRLQTVGLSHHADEVLVRGDAEDRMFSLVYRRQGRVIALDCINSVRDYVQGRLVIESGQIHDPNVLADSTVPLKSLVKA